MQKAHEEKELLKKEKEALCDFQTKVSELVAWFVEEQSKVTQQSILSSLTLANVARVEKESAVEAFLAEIKNIETRF